MGIRNLNKYLLKACSEKAISIQHLSALKGKTITIDTSIYLYKYLGEIERGENRLKDRLTQLIDILKYYEINPIFIFDGPPPQEKMDILILRSIKKRKAEDKYNNLSTYISQTGMMTSEYSDTLNNLQRQFIRIKDCEIQMSKEIMEQKQVKYYEAEGEADQLCVSMVNQNKACATVSDDMDMFSYGCKCVLRSLDIDTHTIMVYDTEIIIKELKVSMELFTEILLLSSTDYNTGIDPTTINKTFQLGYKYKCYGAKQSSKYRDSKSVLSFYEWLNKNTLYIQDYPKLLKVVERYKL
jgi:5'-3' exonuclease